MTLKKQNPTSETRRASHGVMQGKLQRARRRAGNAAAVVESLECRTLLTSWSWQDQMIGLDKEVQNYPSINGAGQTVVVIDRGVDYNHYALGSGYGNKVINAWNFDNNTWDVMPYDNDAHGTGTAGEIAGDQHAVSGQLYQGVAPGAKIIALKAQGTTEIKEAFDWVVAHRSQYNIVAVNWASPNSSVDTSQLLGDMYALTGSGVFIAGPVGNYGPSAAYAAPAGSFYQIGSTNSSDQLSSFTPRGTGVDLVAPGDNVDVTWYYNGAHEDLPSSGTSWSSPQVVGAAALIKQVNPSFTPAQIMQILRDSGHWVWDSTSNMSYSRLDVNAAIALAFQRSGQASAPAAAAPVVSSAPAASSSSVGSYAGRPFTGSGFNVGSTIEAEWYDTGGEGVGYHDTTNWNESGANYRGDGVDATWMNADGGSNFVGWTHGGEWLSYTVNAATAGSYNFLARLAIPDNNASFHVEVDGSNVTGSITETNTGSWTSFTTVTKSGVWLSAGKHVVRVVMDSNGSSTGFNANFNWFSFTAGSGVTASAASTVASANGSFVPSTWTVPNGPYSLSAWAASSSSMNIVFNDNADNEQGLVIERATLPNGSYQVVGTVYSDASSSASKMQRSFTDYGLSGGTNYYYRIHAYNQYGSSSYAYGSGRTA